MSRIITVFVVLIVVLSGTAVMVGTGPAIAQESDGGDDGITPVELGAVEGATICAEQVDSDVNRLTIEGGTYEDITAYLGENARMDLSQTEADSTLILHTDRQDENINLLAESEECISADQQDVVVNAYSFHPNGLTVTGYSVQAGHDVIEDVPEPAGSMSVISTKTSPMRISA